MERLVVVSYFMPNSRLAFRGLDRPSVDSVDSVDPTGCTT